jgi:hypothetical protein
MKVDRGDVREPHVLEPGPCKARHVRTMNSRGTLIVKLAEGVR